MIFIISLPLILSLLFAGNTLTVKKKESILNDIANKLVMQYKEDLEYIGEFNFNMKYLEKSEDMLKTISSIDNNFPTINAIHRISYENKPLFICVKNNNYWDRDKKLNYTDFIYTSNESERKYMNSILDNKKDFKTYFESRKGNYKLIIPIKTSSNRIYFLLLTDYQQYGKIGS